MSVLDPNDQSSSADAEVESNYSVVLDSSDSVDAQATVLEGAIDGTELEVYSSSSGASSADSEDGDVSDTANMDEEHTYLESMGTVRSQAVNHVGIFVSSGSGLGHLMKDEYGEKFVCGKKQSANYVPGISISRKINMCLRCQPVAQ